MLRHFLDAMDDYTLDRRGDIGAWVREAAMQGLADVLTSLAKRDKGLIPEDLMLEAAPRLAQQACEKIDRTRGLAVKIFSQLLRSARDIPGFPRRDEVLACYPQQFDAATFQWTVESETFPIFCGLLKLPEYRDAIILGLSVSVGGLTERLVKHSSASLFSELRGMVREQLDDFCDGLLSVFKEHEKRDRVTVPLLKMLDQLLTSGFLDPVLEDDQATFPMALLTQVKGEVNKCADPNKLMSAADVLCALLQAADQQAVKKSLTQLAIFLCHRFPRVRRVTAGKLFEALLTYSDRPIVAEDRLDEVQALLSDTRWEQMAVEELRPVRNKLCEMMGVQAPAVIRKVLP